VGRFAAVCCVRGRGGGYRGIEHLIVLVHRTFLLTQPRSRGRGHSGYRIRVIPKWKEQPNGWMVSRVPDASRGRRVAQSWPLQDIVLL